MNTTEHQLDLVKHIESLDSSTLYTLKQAMSLLNISRATIYRRLSELNIVSHKIDGIGYLDQTMMDQLREIKRTVVPGTVSTSQPNDAVVTLLQEISDKLSQLIERIDQIPAQNPPKKSSQVSNKLRAAESKQRVIDAYRELEAKGKLPLHTNGHINQSEFAHLTNIPRGTIAKYIKYCL